MAEIQKKGRLSPQKLKEELITSNSNGAVFKDAKNIINLKGKVNGFLNEHFDQKTFEKTKKEEKNKGKIKSRFDKNKAVKGKKLIGLFSDLVSRLGLDENAREINKKILFFIIAFNTLITLMIAGIVVVNDKSVDVFVLFMVILWTVVFIALYLLTALMVFVYLDVRMYQHVKEIEESLPDFLQLASANISAGMTVDRSLWYAIRPKFGILALEMENVAKSTFVGEDLEQALVKLGQKYDSRMLKETINLIVEGIQSGGEMAVLLSKLSTNIKETQLMRKEIGASVTTYAIFIGAATIVAAPMLFALSTELLIIIQQIFGSIHIDPGAGGAGSFTMNLSGDSVNITDFKRFAILVLVISSFFSAAIISVIQKGNVKDGIKTIPIFIIVSLILYFAATALFSTMLGGMF
jgi:Flp pilus assembly protein TadB